MNIAIDVRSILQQPVVAEELRKWPLMHGTLCPREELEHMKIEGLIAGKAAPNSFDYDRELGRTNSVFLAPASFRMNYGFGVGSVFVDAALLSNRRDLRFSDLDVGSAVECLKIVCEHGEQNYCGDARDVTRLAELVRQQKVVSPTLHCRDLVLEIVHTDSFTRYYDECYKVTEAVFFKSIEEEAKSRRANLYQYFARTGLWSLHEEILAPVFVEPQYLLGDWDGRCWTEWRKASTPDVQYRLQAWLEAATTRSKQ